ncbi:DegT/DnrJ/EryC1/StrS family aminotransferase [Lelliottia sp. V89_10]|uniref:DegT/DnrJ/EryC1/StrS family aminotransferase n=1 Tax=Lelliottia wanjuensis TaxID=3050585 RepID=UPI00249EA558|nr:MULTISPECIES: DegT/DnrJ/EryC1/StrS family aminotransferase [unclassified Lelliottia]MDI3361448.1 DegT/DnrJ/EryC1/StrS family aminotransferase [Lelliottia sp. V89_13]MDK9549351.1 DegT/DnrJ/EryC1/StrS family aminotransferase [Lelliottia sp. V89_5]MDK9596052.1 DegT/DnrJ/EryC1/StrS family aminotransferase [Lelliottia sp. V89_10]
MIELFHVSFEAEIKKIVLETLDSKAIASGPNIPKLESRLSDFFPGKHALAVNDMTNGMTVLLSALGISSGDEVLVSPFSCLATTSPMALLGVRPVWVDINSSNMAMDINSVVKKITPKTKAILVYHVAGYPSDVDALSKIARERGLLLIEDCNSAFGSKYNNQLLGSLADAVVLSFYPNRQIGSIDGAAILFSDKQHYELAKLRRRYGVDFNGFRKPNGEINEEKDVATYGYSATINNISAGIINAKLDDLTVQMQKTNKNAIHLDATVVSLQKKYNEVIKCVKPLDRANINNWVYFVDVKNKNIFMDEMKKNDVQVSSLHLRNDLYSCFNSDGGSLPGMDKVSESIVAIPCGHWLTEDEMAKLTNTLIQTVSHLAE